MAQTVYRLGKVSMVPGSNTGAGERLLRTQAEQLWGPPSPLYNSYIPPSRG
jgi:hypothetical protein